MATATADALSAPAREFLARTPGKLLIGGEWEDAAAGDSFATIDPSTGEEICQVAQAGADDVARAVAAAQAALDGPLRKVNASKRSALMNALAELIKANGDELAELESLDNGKPLQMAKYDVAATVNHLRYYAGWPTKIEGETIPVSARDVLCYTLREPVGVCAQIIPWNYPLVMAAWKISPGARRRLSDRAEARRADAADGASPRRAGARGRASRGHPQRPHRRRRDGRGPGRRSRRRQGGVHGLHGRWARDRGEVRQGAEAGDARARRQEPEHHPAGRGPRAGDPGLLRGDLLELRPGVQRGLAAVRGRRALRRGRRWPRGVREQGQGRARPGP